MGYFVGIPLGGATEKDYQVRFGKNMTFQVETRAPHLPAEWALQSGVQLTWPHAIPIGLICLRKYSNVLLPLLPK